MYEYVNYNSIAQVNGVELHYSVLGGGKPVVLLHGNGGGRYEMSYLQNQLAQTGYRAVAIDSRGQGENPPVPEYHYADMAEDVYQFIEGHNLQMPAVFGWSDGGIIALLLELMHPGTCSSLTICGANTHPSGIIEGVLPPYRENEWQPPLTRMMQLEPDIKPWDLRKIVLPVLVMAGEKDLIRPEHTRFIADFLPKGELKIIPGEDHGSYILNSPLAGDHMIEFLKRHYY